MKKPLALLAFLLALAPAAFGAVTYVTSATAIESNFDTDISLSINASGAQRLALCAVYLQQGGGIGLPTTTGVTYNGVAMSAVDDITAGSGDHNISLWSLVAPDTGTQTVTATTDINSWHTVGCIVFSGVDQSMPLGTAATNSGTGNLTTTITVPSSGMGAYFVINADVSIAGSATVDGSSTKRFDFADAIGLFTSVGSTTASTGSVGMTVNNPNGFYTAGVAVPINAATAAPSGPRRSVVVVQ